MSKKRKVASQPDHGAKSNPPIVTDKDNVNVRELHELERANLVIQRRMFVATCVVAAVTAAYVTITLLQYFALREQIADARRSGDLALRETRNAQRLDQRAWLGVTEFNAPKHLSDHILLSVTLKNSGKTPARAVKMSLHVLALPCGK